MVLLASNILTNLILFITKAFDSVVVVSEHHRFKACMLNLMSHLFAGLNLPCSILQNCPRILQIQHIVVSPILFSDRSDKTPTAIPTLGLRMKPHIVSAGLKVNITSEFKVPEKAHRLLQKPRVRLDLTRQKQIRY